VVRGQWIVVSGRSAVSLLPTAHCLLPTAYRLPPTAYCLLPTAHCRKASKGHPPVASPSPLFTPPDTWHPTPSITHLALRRDFTQTQPSAPHSRKVMAIAYGNVLRFLRVGKSLLGRVTNCPNCFWRMLDNW